MASVNKVMLIGNLTRDPEVRYTPKGSAVADIGLAINRYFTMEIARPERPALTDWYDRLTKRRAYHDTVMTSYDELRGN